MKAIRTKYHGPTATKGARITATEPDGAKATIRYPSELNSDQAHALAAQTLCRKMGWTGTLVSGALSDSYVHVFAD
jgi:hypothetical protein